MSQSFSFPPPPPPPPQRDSPVTHDSRGGFRGRSHGRGQSFRGSNQFSRGRGSYNSHHARRGRGHAQHTSHGPKRDFATAFPRQPRHEPSARPTVPDFNIDVKALLSKKEPTSTFNLVTTTATTQPTTTVEAPKRKNNVLGLTPTNADASESEDDADDEVKLAGTVADEGIQFQHRGQTLSLRTPAEIAAWIAERRKKFPTRAKQEAAKKEADEKKQRLKEQKEAHEADIKAKREAREQMRNARERQKLKEKLIAAQVAKAKSALATTKEDATSQAKLRAEKLRKKAERATQQLRIAEEQLRLVEQGGLVSTNNETRTVGNEHDPESEADSSIISDDENTSSSGSSGTDTDVDSEPEKATSKQLLPNQVTSQNQTPRRASTGDRPLCKNFMKFGRCKYGRNCRFSHKQKRETPKKPPTTTGRRKGLYQVMVEKEQSDSLQINEDKMENDIQT